MKMPNWCNNTLTITGNTETLVQLKPVLEAGQGLLEAIKPIGDWDYNNAVEAWGTKWDVDTECLVYTDNGDGTSSIQGHFDSAWAPPIEAFNTLAEDWDSCYIELKYFEGGMDFIGVWDSEGGDAYWEGIQELVNEDAHKEDAVLGELIDEFGLEEWYDEMAQMEDA